MPELLTGGGIFLFRGDELLLRDDGALPAEPHGLAPDSLVAVREGAAPGWLTGWLPREVASPPGHSFHKLRTLYTDWPAGHAALAGEAAQVARWVRTHRFCGACGEPTARVEGERAMKCTGCGEVMYPRISPVVMVLIRHGERVLLAKPAQSATGRYSVLAGFVEAGETLEQAVHREVMEEVGLQVDKLRYFGSQAWPFPHSLLVGFVADLAGGELRPDPREIGDAVWVAPGDAWPPIPDHGSLAGPLIRSVLFRSKG